MKFGVITFPGSNSDFDLIYVLADLLNQPTVSLWHKDTNLQNVDVVCLPGGFAYGDYLRSGAIARFSPIMKEVVKFAEKGGFVWGICNGFQILTESGLLPGALLRNKNTQFICQNVWIQPAQSQSNLVKNLECKPYKIPIAHGEGNYYCSPDMLKEIHDNEQILFHYTSAEGALTDGDNPNGSLANIAGICNSKKNVWGMMPHPERASDPYVGNTDGVYIFQNLLNNLG